MDLYIYIYIYICMLKKAFLQWYGQGIKFGTMRGCMSFASIETPPLSLVRLLEAQRMRRCTCNALILLAHQIYQFTVLPVYGKFCLR